MAVGLGADTISGGNQWDYYWTYDSDIITDLSALELTRGYVHIISEFHHVSYDGGVTSTPVGLDPLGEDLADPLPVVTDTGLVMWNFNDRALFPSRSPTKNDLFQGKTLGDCYFLSALAAIADSDPEFIRNMVVALGDGTYAVRFYLDESPVYVRAETS
jgi:hypothetical protein